MAVLFYILRTLGVLLGAFTVLSAWVAISSTYSGPGVFIVISPGLTIVGSSLLLLAIDSVLGRLDRIVENTGPDRTQRLQQDHP
jgi:hypothetical protein